MVLGHVLGGTAKVSGWKVGKDFFKGIIGNVVVLYFAVKEEFCKN